jgi:Protein of unknown function (DUF3109)
MDKQDQPAAAGLTAFSVAQASLRKRCADSRIDAAEFQRKLSRCSLASCFGTCCYDGVQLDDDMAPVLEDLVTRRRADFDRMQLELPAAPIVDVEREGVARKKTAVKPFPYRSLVAGYPEHFEETACAFLLGDGRCALQALAMQDNLHPWYYKPFTCWLHPIKIADGQIRLFDETTDPYRSAGYDGFVARTFCGRTSPDGRAAADVLKEELDFLARLLGRDIAAKNGPADRDAEG